MTASFIFIGSTHGFIDDFLKQKEIIEAVKPEFVLCENLENLELNSKEKFEEVIKKKKISDMTSFQEVEKLVLFCFSHNIKLIGIDLKNFGFDKTQQKKIKNQEELSKKEESEIERLLFLRERQHLNKIKEYQKKTNKPLVIILGCWYLRDNSLLRNNLENYKIVAPCDKKGNLLMSPPENNDIRYCEIKSDGK